MAGFAVFMTIVTYGFLGIVLATIAATTLVLLARKRLPQGLPGRRAFLSTCAFAPFAGLLWLVAAFLIHVQISNRLAHQDCGSLSPDPFVTLPNGYVLGSHNTYDGYIVAPGYETDVPVTGPGYVRSLIDIEQADGYFRGTLFDFKTSKVRRFTFNTKDRSIQTFDTGDTSDFGSQQTMVHQDSASYWVMYEKYRHDWPNYILTILILPGEAAIALWLWRYWASMRQRDAKT